MRDLEFSPATGNSGVLRVWADYPRDKGMGVWLESNDGDKVRVPEAAFSAVKDFFIKAVKEAATERQSRK